MNTNLFQRVVYWISLIGAAPNETEDLRLQRNLLLIGTLMFIFAGIVWGLTYTFFGGVLAGSIPFSYSVFSALSVVMFAVARRYGLFRFSQLLLILLTNDFNASRPVDFRIGINSGPVLAGVIGRKKFIYDLWGDAVNLASRMESHVHGGVIQITRATYEHIKGKGEMEAWHVMSIIESAHV